MSKPIVMSCPECGGSMRHEARLDEVSYLGKTRSVEILGWWCSTCDEAILDGVALRARQVAFLELKAQADGVLGPAEVASVRERIGLSQRKAGELLGGGPRAFQKYESGEQAVSVPMSRLLVLLGNQPKRLRELTRASTPARKASKPTHG